MMDATATLAVMDRRSLVHPFTRLDDYGAGRTPEPQVVAGGKGVMVYDSHGNAFIDGFSGLYCVNVGYGEQRIIDAITAQASKLAYFHAFAGATNEPAIALGEKLLELAGPSYQRVFFGLSGSDANDTQVKLVWYYNNVRGLPRKKKVIARRRGYHGATVVTASLTGLDLYKQGFDTLDGLFKHTIAADPFWRGDETVEAFVQRCADDLDGLIRAEGPETVGAFIAEPMIGAGGIVPPPPGYWAAIQAVLRRHDVLLILDEVVTGFGRVGAMFAAPGWGIEPDLVTLAKGLTSAYLPLSAVLVGTKVWEVLQAGAAKHGIFGHGYTYTAHPLCAAAASANIAVIEADGLCANARNVGAYLERALRDRFEGQPLVGEVRAAGMIAAVEFVADGAPRRHLAKATRFAPRMNLFAREEGLMARTMSFGDIVGLAPPLILTEDQADRIVAKLGRAYDRTLAELTPDEHAGRG